MRTVWTFLAGCMAVLAVPASRAGPAEITVLSAGAMKTIVTELA
jgi:ABC-type molybdate transport system substrate-binding protein